MQKGAIKNGRGGWVVLMSLAYFMSVYLRIQFLFMNSEYCTLYRLWWALDRLDRIGDFYSFFVNCIAPRDIVDAHYQSFEVSRNVTNLPIFEVVGPNGTKQQQWTWWQFTKPLVSILITIINQTLTWIWLDPKWWSVTYVPPPQPSNIRQLPRGIRWGFFEEKNISFVRFFTSHHFCLH